MENKKALEELLTRGVEEIIDQKNLEKKLKRGKKLRVKLGIDPTSPHLHLGRSIPLLKLRDFQKLGHKIVFIIGDFTGTIGDTSDKESERPMLSPNLIKKNLKTYIRQVSKIIDIKKAEICYNSQWLKKLGYLEISQQANLFSLNEFISRENIKKRYNQGKRISLRELLYPLMQAYDSVAIRADVEVGGTDQRFNLLAGRSLQRYYHQNPQDIITNPLIEGLDGKKMSSSFQNTINLLDRPNEMFGKIMSLKDSLIIKYFILLTRVDLSLVEDYQKQLKKGVNPRDIKLKLAFEIVRFYHSLELAKKAEEYFIKTFSQKEIPSQLKYFKPSQYDLLSVLFESKLVSSKAEGRRLLKQKGVKVNGKIVTQENYLILTNSVLQKGKRSFIKII